MTDATTNGAPVALATQDADGGVFALAQRRAKALSVSDLVPQSYRGNMPNCLIAIEVAARIGASPLAVMQSLHVIQGRPSFSAAFLIACANATGRFSPLRYEWQGQPGTPDWGCRAVATDKATGQACVGPLVTWRMADAEGWTKKSGSKWRTMPELMFCYRAGAFWVRVFAPELSLGLHTSEEVVDMSAGAVPTTGIDASRGTAADLAALLADDVPETPRSAAMREPGEEG